MISSVLERFLALEPKAIFENNIIIVTALVNGSNTVWSTASALVSPRKWPENVMEFTALLRPASLQLLIQRRRKSVTPVKVVDDY